MCCSLSVEDPSSDVVHSGYRSLAPHSFKKLKQSAFLGAQQLTVTDPRHTGTLATMVLASVFRLFLTLVDRVVV